MSELDSVMGAFWNEVQARCDIVVGVTAGDDGGLSLEAAASAFYQFHPELQVRPLPDS